MERFKKALRVLCLVLLIMLASAGAGIFGALPAKSSRKDEVEITTEENAERGEAE